MTDFKTKNESPVVDSYKRVLIVFYILGIVTLVPWNFFISVSEYWKYKFRTLNETSENGLNDLQLEWNSNLTLASMIPNVSCLLLNAFFGHKFPLRPRLLFSLAFLICLFIITIILSKVNSDDWQNEFYGLTIFNVILMNISSAIFQSGLVGLVGKFPPLYINAVFSGQSFGGIFANLVIISLLLFGADFLSSGFLCFLIALLLLCISLLLYMRVTKTKFFLHYESPEEKSEMMISLNKEEKEEEKVNPFQILRQIWMLALSVFTIFTITIGCYPALTVLIESTGPPSEWTLKYFRPVICFLGYNIGDLLGRFLAGKIQINFASSFKTQILIFLLCLLRIVFIPLFIFCNGSPKNRSISSVYFHSDTIYMAFMALFSISNGYLSSTAMMKAPQLFRYPGEQSVAATVMMACLGLGLGMGALLSKFVLYLL